MLKLEYLLLFELLTFLELFQQQLRDATPVQRAYF